MHFTLVHVVPEPGFLDLGCQEVIETAHWGLTELGHTVSVRRNQLGEHGTNIIFGFQVWPAEIIDRLPPDTIAYNPEQLANLSPTELKPAYQAAIRRLCAWDYSPGNLATWGRLSAERQPIVVPIGWAPLLSRIPKRAGEDIDVLLYGMPSETRLRVPTELGLAGACCVFACGLYGAARDELISRAKLVLNLNRYNRTRVFEVVRTTYFLELYHHIDIVLDTFPYPEEFVRIAAELAQDLPRLGQLRAKLRQRLRHSPLMDAPRFARNIEAAYRDMWRRWCAAPPGQGGDSADR